MSPKIDLLIAPLAFATFAFASVDWDEARTHVVSATMVTLAGTLLGFVVAAVSILVALVDKALARMMRKTGHFDDLLRHLLNTGGLFCVCLFAGLLALASPHSMALWAVATAMASFVIGMRWLISAGLRMMMMLRHLE